MQPKHDETANEDADSSSSDLGLEPESIQPSPAGVPLNSKLLLCLYTSHFLSRWGDRMWEFAVGLFMYEVWKHSLLFTSLYGLVEAASVAVLGTVVGDLVDKSPRLKVIQISLGVQNGAIVIATLALVVLLSHPGSMPEGFITFFLMVIMINILGGIAALAEVATNISVERDWVVILSTGESLQSLTAMNSMMRRIDLSCKLLAPVLVGFLMSFVSVLAAAILIAAWNLISVWLEYWLLLFVYSETPALHGKALFPRQRKKSERVKEDYLLHACNDEDCCDETHNAHVSSLEGNTNRTDKFLASFLKKFLHLSFFDSWQIYMQQEMVLAATSLSMLYFTVLSFGSLMTAALSWRGVPTFVLGLARGISAMIGIGATIAFPIMNSRIKTLQTGLLSISLQWIFLFLCCASVWIHNVKISSSLLMGGVAASRLGLWMFDLSVTQLMQETVSETERGVVGGVQNSLQSMLQLLSYLLGMFFPEPKDFGKLVVASYASVTMALILYSIQVYHVCGYLFKFHHLSQSYCYSSEDHILRGIDVENTGLMTGSD